MPRPAQPTPGTGPPDSTHSTPVLLDTTRSSSSASPFCRRVSNTVGMGVPPVKLRVESALGSQPICSTISPMAANAAATLDTVVDLPMPPLP
ncbi:Uncharacterised protein [Mycobacterium tuberculosis]|nr:Uncharacterised protein [Mycobacterium tuberculosis]